MPFRSTLAAQAALVAALVAAAAATAAPTAGQDVELLAEIHGTPLPPGYRAWREGNPDAFHFAHGRPARMRERMRSLQGSPSLSNDAFAVLGPREGAVQGTFRIPVVLGLFSDSPPTSVPYPRDAVQSAYFGAGAGTIKRYYADVSGGRVTLEGDVQDWARASLTQAVAAGGKSGLLPPARVGDFIVSLLDALPSMDWAPYDNDGPDGLPNSGDDDGYVDALAIIHPTSGAECSGSQNSNKIWSHKWNLASATSSRSTYRTTTPSANGGFIRVDDYFIQPIYDCNNSALNEIGVFTHETGHAFGLPDLYDTFDGDGKHNGDGNWDLMATGAWGCDGRSPESPCHMGAWSKAVLGWVNVVTLGADRDLGTLTVRPVETGGDVLRIDAGDGSGEYYLLENRQRLGFDQGLPGTGLLVWQINPTILAARWPQNTVNAYSQLGVWLRQADGLEEINTPGGGRGDADDPFPYVSGATSNRVFHAGSKPASRSQSGSPSGLTLLDIEKSGQDILLRALTRFTNVTVRAEGNGGADGIFAVDGKSIAGTTHTYRAAPFAPHVLTPVAGETLGEGVRRPFVGWDDDASAPRERTLATPLEDAVLTARYGGRQVELGMDVAGGVDGISPGSFEADPSSADLWFEEGAMVTLRAVPRTGFGFLEWTGALAGRPNPVSLTMDVPMRAGAAFEVTYKMPATTVTLEAAEATSRTFAPENGNAPFYWYVVGGALPEGLFLDPEGRLTGAALDTGTFAVDVEVRDAIGLTADGRLTLEVVEPDIPVERLGAPFLLVGQPLTAPERSYLDRHGNADGAYDLGDFRAWVLGHPSLALSAAARALVGTRGGR